MFTTNDTHPASTAALHSPAMGGWLSLHQQDAGKPAPQSGRIVTSTDTTFPVHETSGSGFSLQGTEVPHVDETHGLAGIVLGSPRWLTAELQEISRELGHSAALTAAYLAHGQDLTSQLRGAYSLVLLAPSESLALLAVDRLGRSPVYYHQSDDCVYFGSSAAIVNRMRPEPADVSNQGLYTYIYFHMLASPHTAFSGLKKLQAGFAAQFDGKKERLGRYWLPDFSEKAPAAAPVLYQSLREKLKNAVARSLPEDGKVGAFLSGGLDSSTVTGMLAELSNGPCDAYSIGFAAEGYDEMAYARITAEHFGARLHEYYVTPDDVVAALPLIASSYDEPFGNSSALPAYFCAKMAAEDGVSHLLAGDGGDELFAGNERYAKQKTFEIYARLPGVVRGALAPAVQFLPTWIPFSDKARSYIKQAETPLPDRLQTYNFLHQNLATEMFREEFLAEINTELPLELQREIYHAPAAASSLNRMLFLDWQITLADNDLRKVSQTCALAGVEVAYPMLDDELVEFSLGIPSNQKLPGKQLRDFYKRALKGWLPDATISKSKQGFGLPFGVWMREHKPLQDIAYDNILTLKAREIFRDAFLDNAIAMHKQGHAAYFGELIWILCVLELWMSSHLRPGEGAKSKK